MDQGNNILFKETQAFRQWWVWLILIGTDALLIVAMVQQIGFGKPFGENPASDAGLIAIMCLVFLLSSLFVLLRLETEIKADGIYVRFFPIQRAFKFYAWESIDKFYVREYSPIKEYGGWGIRFGSSQSGRAYNVSGNKGLQIEFKDGSKLLIGTKKEEELNAVIGKLGVKP